MDPFPKSPIRSATVEDAKQILEIYSPYITNSFTSFEFDVPSEEEMKTRIANTLQNFPWLVYETEDGSIGGYAYAGKHRVRAGYQWATEVAVYISPACSRLGIGSQLYDELLRILVKQGYFKALAIIVGDTNQASVKFHEQKGFAFEGRWKNVGNKFGKWVDVSWYTKDLQVLMENPDTPVPYSQLSL